MITPYTGAYTNIPDNAKFNETFSSGRVIIEHVMGILKSRWSSLKGIRTQANSKSCFKPICEWVLCCIILHNIANGLGDEVLEGWETNEDMIRSNDFEGNLSNSVILNADTKREQLKNVILKQFY